MTCNACIYFHGDHKRRPHACYKFPDKEVAADDVACDDIIYDEFLKEG